MDLRDDLKQVTEQLSAAHAKRARLDARIRGLIAEREALVATIRETEGLDALEDGDDLAGLRKARAIAAVLGHAGTPLRIQEIVGSLHARGRPNETYNGVSVYLDEMLKKGLVRRIERGLYAAV